MSNKRSIERLTKVELKEAANELKATKDEEKKPFSKKEYDKEYSKKKATIKIYKEYHEKADKEAKKRFMSISKYIEYLINEDTK
jgi:predicted HicB family RNase H-like nuclease